MPIRGARLFVKDKMDSNTCLNDNCDRSALSRGRCGACYQRARRAGELPPLPGRHTLTNLDLERQVATCGQCGPGAPIKIGPGARRQCRGAVRAWRNTDAGRAAQERRSARERLAKYGLDEADFKDLEARQGGLCAICKEPAELVIDHSHDTGAVRGLLCHGCNVGLGFFQDDPARLGRAIAYLT